MLLGLACLVLLLLAVFGAVNLALLIRRRIASPAPLRQEPLCRESLYQAAPEDADGSLADDAGEEIGPLPDEGPLPQEKAAVAPPEGSAFSVASATRRTAASGRGKNHVSSATGFFMNSLFARGLIIAAITLGLLIPLAFVSDVVDERSAMRRKAVKDIAGLWGESQTVSGPALVIPYKREYEVRESVTDAADKKKIVVRKAYAQEHRVILPKRVDFDALLHPQVRHRGIYEYVVYTSPITVKGQFRLPQKEAFGENVAEIQWDKAWFSLGVTDLKAITKVEPLVWNKETCPAYNPGGNIGNLLGPGFHTFVPLRESDAGQGRDFSLAVKLNGSGGLRFTTVGETTNITVAGDWPHPSFSGSLLPASREITPDSFKGVWHVPHLSRTYPQSGILGQGDFSGKSAGILSFTAGVDLFETVSLYSQVNRSVKYGILFIGLTFVALLAFELVTKARMHLMQYALVGIAMTLFYLVLLSLAEHTSFLNAFVAASLISIAMNGLYIAAAMRSRNKGLVVTGLLTALYLLLYALLQMEEYALLVGTFMVLLVVGILMYLTRNLPTAEKNAS